MRPRIYKEGMAKKTGKKASDIVFEPKLRPIKRSTALGVHIYWSFETRSLASTFGYLFRSWFKPSKVDQYSKVFY